MRAIGQCHSCMWYDGRETECRRHPPAPTFPNTGAGDWCGEFIPASDACESCKFGSDYPCGAPGDPSFRQTRADAARRMPCPRFEPLPATLRRVSESDMLEAIRQAYDIITDDRLDPQAAVDALEAILEAAGRLE